MVAISQGPWTPPHMFPSSHASIAVQCRLSHAVARLGKLARQAGLHLARRQRQVRRSEIVGTNVFIGHGRSLVWRELKDFLQDRLHLPVDEFNRVPVAGVTNTERLLEMMDAAAIAFLVMTGEDEQPDGQFHPRLNVIHEAGLFQGRLGFTRAIVLLEEGCEEFSNIAGLGQIRFARGNIEGGISRRFARCSSAKGCSIAEATPTLTVAVDRIGPPFVAPVTARPHASKPGLLAFGVHMTRRICPHLGDIPQIAVRRPVP